MIVLTGPEVRRVLTPELAYTSARAAFASLRDAATVQPVRQQVELPDGVMLLKPAAIGGRHGVKVVSILSAGVQGFLVLMDPCTGRVDALVDGAALTELRTAAASALATDLLARPDAARLGLLGTGAQARSHLLALKAARDLSRVLAWSPSGADRLVAWAAERGIPVEQASCPEEVVRESDIVCTLTTSPVPVLQGAWLRAGTHINAVGAFRASEREVDGVAVQRATVVVDMHEAASAEAGALLLAQQEGLIGAQHVKAELSQLVNGQHPGRTRVDEITLFSSTGLASQDIAAAGAAVEAARTQGVGLELQF